MLWCRREHDFCKDAPSLAPEHDFARPAPRARTPHFAREVSQKRPRGGRGLEIGCAPAPCLLLLFTIVITEHHAHEHRITTVRPRRPRGAADFPCLRQLPPPPKRAPAQKGSDVKENDQSKRKKKENARKQKNYKTKLTNKARPAMKQRVRRPTSHNLCFQGAKTTFRPHETQKASCESQQYIIFHHNNEAVEKTIKNKPFPPLAAGAEARRTLKNAYPCMVSEGDRSPPVAAAVKEPPSATHGSLVVIEHGRTHKTTIRYPLFALETRTPSH